MKNPIKFIALVLITVLILLAFIAPPIDDDQKPLMNQAGFVPISMKLTSLSTDNSSYYRIETKRHEGNKFYVLLDSNGEPVAFIRP